MGARAELIDAWADLVHGSACIGCEVPGRPWCRSCARMLDQGLQAQPMGLEMPGLVGACMGEYDGWLRAMILAHKEYSAWSLAEPLGRLLAQAVLSVASQGGWVASGEVIVLVPIPSRRSTVRSRGHNPSLRMARAAARQLRVSGHQAQALPLLRLRFPVRDSVGLNVAARGHNLVDAFAVAPKARSALGRLEDSARIVICDDVMTTGATAREAASAVALAGLPASGVVTVASVRNRRDNIQATSDSGWFNSRE